MSAIEIYKEILKNPSSPQLYKKLASFYSNAKMDNEAQALASLVEKKLVKNANPNIDKE